MRGFALGLVLTTACANPVQREDSGFDATRPDVGVDAFVRRDAFVPDAFAPQDAYSSCTTNCTTDQDCTDTCEPISSAMHCCETSTSRCFVTHAAICPTIPDAGDAGACPPTCVHDRDCQSCPFMDEGSVCCAPLTHTCAYYFILDVCPGVPITDGGLPPPGYCATACTTNADCADCTAIWHAPACCDQASGTCEYVHSFSGTCPSGP